MAAAPGPALPRALVVHDLAQARTALAAARAAHRPVLLLSAPSAAGAVGPAWFAEMVRQARAEFPDVRALGVLDCAKAAGRAMAALRVGLDAVIFTGSYAMLMKLGDVADGTGTSLIDHRPKALDLADRRDALLEATEYLARG